MNHLTKKARELLVDSLRIKVQGGTGGHGLPKYGGIGGKGGDVYIVGSHRAPSLDYLMKTTQCKPGGWFKAADGRPALRTRLMGESGTDLELKVPLGVTVGDSEGQFLGDINTQLDRIIVAQGGRGGDKFNDNHGFIGQKRTIKLDLKMISDAVFVGFPNAGKSSLIRAMSKATPTVASYPFTTLRPYLGVVEYGDYRRITMTDLPGLVEGAHKNLGLGHNFLKHIVRSRVLIFVIEVNPADLGPNYPLRTPLETLCILNKEIELYDDTLLNKPAILVISKVDSFGKSDLMSKYKNFQLELEKLYNSDLSHVDESIRPNKLVKLQDVIPVSAIRRLGLDNLKKATRKVIDDQEELKKLAKDKFSTYEEIMPSEFNRIVQ